MHEHLIPVRTTHSVVLQISLNKVFIFAHQVLYNKIKPQCACARELVVGRFVRLYSSVYSGSRKSLHYNGLNGPEREEDDKLSPFMVPLFFEFRFRSLEKAEGNVPFERNFGPHPLI